MLKKLTKKEETAYHESGHFIANRIFREYLPEPVAIEMVADEKSLGRVVGGNWFSKCTDDSSWEVIFDCLRNQRLSKFKLISQLYMIVAGDSSLILKSKEKKYSYNTPDGSMFMITLACLLEMDKINSINSKDILFYKQLTTYFTDQMGGNNSLSQGTDRVAATLVSTDVLEGYPLRQIIAQTDSSIYFTVTSPLMEALRLVYVYYPSFKTASHEAGHLIMNRLYKKHLPQPKLISIQSKEGENGNKHSNGRVIGASNFFGLQRSQEYLKKELTNDQIKADLLLSASGEGAEFRGHKRDLWLDKFDPTGDGYTDHSHFSLCIMRLRHDIKIQMDDRIDNLYFETRWLISDYFSSYEAISTAFDKVVLMLTKHREIEGQRLEELIFELDEIMKDINTAELNEKLDQILKPT